MESHTLATESNQPVQLWLSMSGDARKASATNPSIAIPLEITMFLLGPVIGPQMEVVQKRDLCGM
jgi:hypothetical protein